MKWNSKTLEVPSKKVLPVTSGAIRRSDIHYRQDWDAKRATMEALDRVTWVFRCVDAIASNQAKLELGVRQGNRFRGKFLDEHPIYKVLNSRANRFEEAIYFRYRLSAQFLLSKKGVFIQIIRSRGGEVLELVLLDPTNMEIIPDPKNYVKEYRYTQTYTLNGQVVKDVQTFNVEDIIWIRRPHPFNPYSGMTPLESAGLAIETDWLAKLYNRNFLVNDGRPGGIVAVKGDIDDDNIEELRARFGGGVSKAGRVTVIATEGGADFVDTAVTPRDAQYQETRSITKEEILIAFGVPESVLANASQRTLDNAEQERLIFWQETMTSHLDFIAAPFDVLDDSPTNFVSFNTSTVDVLQRAEIKRREFLLREWDGGATDVNEYRQETGRDPIPGQEGKIMFVPKTKVPWATSDGSELPQIEVPNTAGRPASSTVTEQPENDPRDSPEDDRMAPLDNSPNSAPTTQLSQQPYDIKSLTETSAAYQKTVDMWAFAMKREIERAAERMARVLGEKISGPAFKKAFFDGDNPTEKLFNKEVWVKQLNDDLTACQKSAYFDGYKTASSQKIDHFPVSMASSYNIKRIVNVFEDAVKQYVISMENRPDFREATTKIQQVVAETADKIDIEDVEPLATEAFFRGVLDGCKKAGLKKVWFEKDGYPVILEPDEAYSSGKYSARFPASISKGIIAPVLQEE